MNTDITKENLDAIYAETFNMERFKVTDPCGVVYQLIDHIKEFPEEHINPQLDIELGALFVAMITWGSRKVIYPTAENMIMREMGWKPSEFILNGKFEESYSEAKNNCVYRTLNVQTFKEVCRSIQSALSKEKTDGLTLERLFEGKSTIDVIEEICEWLAPAKIGTMHKSACKRVCMYVRWMTRSTVPDLNVWKSRNHSDLYAVMDTHVIQLTEGLLKNKRPTWKACVELTDIFKSWDAEDPLKYDIALMTLADRMTEEVNSKPLDR